MPGDSPTAGGVPRPEDTDKSHSAGESGPSRANESQDENASSNAAARSEKGAVGSFIEAVINFAAATMGIDPSELQPQQVENNADPGNLQNENKKESLTNEKARSTGGNSSGQGNPTKGNKPDVKMKKQILDAGSLLTATVGLNAKMKQHTIVEMEDSISPNGKDDLIPPTDLRKFDEAPFDNKSPKGTKRLAKHAVKNSALPSKAASNQQLLDAFQDTGKSVESEKKEEELEKVSGSDNFMERALNVPWKTGSVALVTSLKTQPEESCLKNETEISPTVSETHENGSTQSDNKVKPFIDVSPESTTSGSENGSETGKMMKADKKRRGSFAFKAVAWALATMAMHPPLKIKVTPKDAEEENLTLQDLSSSEQEKSKEHESDDVTGNSINKSARQNETTDKSTNFVENDAEPGPSRMAKMVVGGPKVIPPADFDDSNDDEGKMQENEIRSLNKEETANSEIEIADLNFDEGGCVQRSSRISRGTQTTKFDMEKGNTKRGHPSTHIGDSTDQPKDKCKPGCFSGVFARGQNDTKNAKNKSCDHQPLLIPNGISNETTMTPAQTCQPFEQSRKPIGFFWRICNFFRRREGKTRLNDVESQLQEDEILTTTSTVSSGTGRNAVESGMETDMQQDMQNSSGIEMKEMMSPDDHEGTMNSGQQGKADTIVDLEDVDEVTQTKHHYEDTRDYALVDELQEAVTEQPTTAIENDSSDINLQYPANLNDGMSKATSNRATQTENYSMSESEDSSDETAQEQPGGIVSYIGNSIRKWWQSGGENEIKDQFEEIIKCDAKLGLSSFSVDDNGELIETPLSKTKFIIIMLLALFNLWKELFNTIYHKRHDKEQNDQAIHFFRIAFYISVLLLLLAHIFLICFGRESIGKAIKRLRRTPSPKNGKSRFSARNLRIYSVLTGVYLIFSGVNVLQSAKEYSIEKIWERHEFDLYRAVLAGSSSVNTDSATTTPATIITTIGIQILSRNLTTTSTWHNSTWINSTLDFNVTAGSITTTPETGILLENSYLETVIFGNLSVALDLIGQIIFSSAPDYLLVIAINIWIFVDSALRVDHLTIEDENGNPLDPEELERRKILAKQSLVNHDEYMEVSSDLNGVGKLIWPALLLCVILMFSYLVYLLYNGMWFMAIYYEVILSKVIPIFYIGGKIAQIIDNYYDWMVSKAGRVLLELDHHEFDRRKAEIKRRPIALGMGPTLVNVKFFFTFFGTVTSNIILLVQSLFTGGSSG